MACVFLTSFNRTSEWVFERSPSFFKWQQCQQILFEDQAGFDEQFVREGALQLKVQGKLHQWARQKL